VGDPVRHAQYRLELADAVHAATAGPVAIETPTGTRPTITVTWTGSTLNRQVGWSHGYDVELRYDEPGREIDTLVERVATAVADWRPNTSAARAGAPQIRPAAELEQDVTYPIVVVAVTVTEPST
jgi:hypothetical protein